VGSEQHFRQDDKLRRLLVECDTAIARAVKSGDRKLSETNEIFDQAIRKLRAYAREFHATLCKGFDAQINDAEKKDGKKEKPIHPRGEKGDIVDFLIQPPLLNENPIIAHLVLFSDSEVPEVLWNFSHYFEPGNEKRLTLAQNPHFYDKELPPRGHAHSDTFSALPIERFQGRIYVLRNSDRRVFLECRPPLRTFDNVWIVNHMLIFRDISGKLESETEVGHHSHALYCSRVVLDANGDPKLEVVCQTDDWRQTIRHLWHTHTLIHFGLISL